MSLFMSEMRIREHLQRITDEFMFNKIINDKIKMSELTNEEIHVLIEELKLYLQNITKANIQLKIDSVDGDTKVEGNTIIRTIYRIRVRYSLNGETLT